MGVLSRDLVESSCKEISHMGYQEILESSCKEISHMALVKRSCRELL